MLVCMLHYASVTTSADTILMKCVYRIDDPLIWGVLPFKYGFDPGNHRWSLGSYDICFKNKCVDQICIYPFFVRLADSNLLISQTPFHFLHARPSPAHSQKCALSSRRTLPANNVSSNPSPLLPTLLKTSIPDPDEPNQLSNTRQ